MEKTEKQMLAYKSLALTEEQKAALKKAEDAVNQLGELGVGLVLNQDTYEFVAINTNELGDYDYDFDYDLTEEDKDNKTILDPFEFVNYGKVCDLKTIFVPAWDFVMIVEPKK